MGCLASRDSRRAWTLNLNVRVSYRVFFLCICRFTIYGIARAYGSCVSVRAFCYLSGLARLRRVFSGEFRRADTELPPNEQRGTQHTFTKLVRTVMRPPRPICYFAQMRTEEQDNSIRRF